MQTEREKIKEDFNFLTRLSSTVNREIGVCICENGESFITFGNECSGQLHCGQCEPKILFHTHPLGTAKPSAGDIHGLLKVDAEIKDAEYCVGAMDRNIPKINCMNVSKSGKYLSISLDNSKSLCI